MAGFFRFLPSLEIFLVCSRRNLRNQTNEFIVSLAVADFCVGLSVIPSLFVCDVTKTCDWLKVFSSWKDVIRWLFSYLSVLNLCSLQGRSVLYANRQVCN